ncbi:MAG: DsbA family protein [Candidatus Uhrbacteria bacterium]|nr:DsbA family protein [Candidatus Uhrbacteria bacterium]
MRDRYLAFLVIGVLTIMVFVFFFIRTQPIPLPKPKISASTSNGVKTPIVTFADPIRGPANAKVTLVEYADFECTACKQLNPLVDIAMKTYPNDVRLVWKDVPNDSAHPHATSASVAAHCAQQQGKFWEFASMLFDRQTYLSDTQYTQIATELGLNVNNFSKCFSSGDTLPIVKKNLQEGLDLGIVATPTLFVGSVPIVGVPTMDDLTKTIADQIASKK